MALVERDLWNGADVRWVGPETSLAALSCGRVTGRWWSMQIATM